MIEFIVCIKVFEDKGEIAVYNNAGNIMTQDACSYDTPFNNSNKKI